MDCDGWRIRFLDSQPVCSVRRVRMQLTQAQRASSNVSRRGHEFEDRLIRGQIAKRVGRVGAPATAPAPRGTKKGDGRPRGCRRSLRGWSRVPGTHRRRTVLSRRPPTRSSPSAPSRSRSCIPAPSKSSERVRPSRGRWARRRMHCGVFFRRGRRPNSAGSLPGAHPLCLTSRPTEACCSP